MAIPTSELQKINPSAIIELFKVELNTLLHGSSTVYRFHAGTNQLNGDIIWQGDAYEKYPIQAEGFEYSGSGSLPRPTLTISNVFGFVSALIINTNKVTAKNDLQGAKFTRLPAVLITQIFLLLQQPVQQLRLLPTQLMLNL